MACDDQDTSIHVAIVGGGITGLTLGIALQQRNIPFTIYERSSGFREIGAGIGFSPNAEEAMKRLAPAIHTSYKQVITPNGEDYFQWVSGETNELMYKLYMGVDGFQGGLRCKLSIFSLPGAYYHCQVLNPPNIASSSQSSAVEQHTPPP